MEVTVHVQAPTALIRRKQPSVFAEEEAGAGQKAGLDVSENTVEIDIFMVRVSRSAQITGARSPCGLNFVLLRLIFLDPLCRTCFMLPFWRLELLGGSWNLRKLLIPGYKYLK